MNIIHVSHSYNQRIQAQLEYIHGLSKLRKNHHANGFFLDLFVDLVLSEIEGFWGNAKK